MITEVIYWVGLGSDHAYHGYVRCLLKKGEVATQHTPHSYMFRRSALRRARLIAEAHAKFLGVKARLAHPNERTI
jgi:hypothetical protein